jgi:ankyrin repeat protein
MNNLPDKNQIKDLILNDIKKKISNNISNGDTTITIPIYVYNMFKDEFEEKGYTIIKKEENNNYKISIPLVILLKNTKEIFNEIVNNKQFEELLNYTNFDLNKNYNFNALLISCKDEKILKHVIDNAIYLECETISKDRPIHLICKNSTPEMIKYIIDKGVDLECENIYKFRPIHYICLNSTPEMIKYIIDKGVDLECENFNGWKPIHYICEYSTPEMIKYIIDKGVNINNLKLEINIKENKKMSDEEKNDITEYVTFKILSEKYKNT